MAVKGEEKDKVQGNLDILFGRLQPYLQILSHDPINAAKDILRSLRDDKEADVISEGCLEKESAVWKIGHWII